jgi:hypothetical protein
MPQRKLRPRPVSPRSRSSERDRTDPTVSSNVRAGVTPKLRADNPPGQWNRFVITMKGDRLTVVLNGQTVIENAQLPGVAARGPLALQHHGDAIEFANLYLREE